MELERQLSQVFEAAWNVVRDREAAAGITIEAFAAAWREGTEAVVEAAERKAQALPRGDEDELPALGPVLQARIVTALELAGVPTKPGEAPRRRPTVLLGVLGAAAAVLVVGGFVVVTSDPGSPASEDDVETAATSEPVGTSSSTSTTSTTVATTTTTTTAVPPPTQPVRSNPTTPPTAPPTTPAPTAPPPTAPPTTSQPTVPTILEFTGYLSGKCENGQDRLVMAWKTVQSTWVWVHTEGAVWEDVSAPNGTTTRCTTKGTKWYLEIRRDGDWLEDTASLYA